MTLLDLLRLMRERLSLVIALPILFATITAVYSFAFMPNQYTATTSMYILQKSSDKETTATSSDLSASQMLANDFATLAKSARIRTRTAEDLGMTSLAGYTVSVTNSTTTRVIELSVTGENPTAAMTIANQMATELSTTATDVMDLQSINIIDAAQEPTSPSGPRRPLYILVAALVGLFAAVAIVVIADMLDTTFKDAREIEEVLELPVIAEMPRIKAK